MAIVPLRAWYLEHYEPIAEIEQRPQDLRLSKNSLLKSALRADFLDEAAAVRGSTWFQRYLAGESIEFYIEGSGSYAIANIDLTSQEIYFVKRDTASHVEPTIFFSHQTVFPESSAAIARALENVIDRVNPTLRFPLRLVQAQRPSGAPLRLNALLLRQIRQSLLFIADATAIAQTPGADRSTDLSLDPKVCLETGYALHAKKPEQLLLIQQQRPGWLGQFPFDLPRSQHLILAQPTSTNQPSQELVRGVQGAIDQLIQRFKLS